METLTNSKTGKILTEYFENSDGPTLLFYLI